jgi:hypothetical protein
MFEIKPFAGAEKKSSPDMKMETDFIYRARKLDATANQLESAYFHLCKVDESAIKDPVVFQLHQDMDTLVRSRFPINRFVDIIRQARKIEARDRELDEKGLK